MPADWTDRELLDYIETHSHTELALVANADVKRFLDLAGYEMPERFKGVAFIPCRYEAIKKLLAEARERLKEATP
jgi:hypothetical protein